MSESMPEASLNGSEQGERLNETRVFVSGLAIIDSQFGPITPPALPEGYSYQQIHTTGSRPWGMVQWNGPEGAGDWHDLLGALSRGSYLVHSVAIDVPGDSATADAAKKALQKDAVQGIKYDNVSLIIAGPGSDELTVIVNRGHLSLETTKHLIEWMVRFVEGRHADEGSDPE